jgi:hypothetical protein
MDRCRWWRRYRWQRKAGGSGNSNSRRAWRWQNFMRRIGRGNWEIVQIKTGMARISRYSNAESWRSMQAASVELDPAWHKYVA